MSSTCILPQTPCGSHFVHSPRNVIKVYCRHQGVFVCFVETVRTRKASASDSLQLHDLTVTWDKYLIINHSLQIAPFTPGVSWRHKIQEQARRTLWQAERQEKQATNRKLSKWKQWHGPSRGVLHRDLFTHENKTGLTLTWMEKSVEEGHHEEGLVSSCDLEVLQNGVQDSGCSSVATTCTAQMSCCCSLFAGTRFAEPCRSVALFLFKTAPPRTSMSPLSLRFPAAQPSL